MRFVVIGESERPVYVPSPAEVRAAHRARAASQLLIIAVCVAVAAVAVWAWATMPVGGV